MIERVANIALVSTAILARSIRAIAESDVALDPNDLPAWAKMIEIYQKITADNPEQGIALTGPGGGPIQVEELKGLSHEQIRDRVGEMARSVLRVIEGGKAGRGIMTATADLGLSDEQLADLAASFRHSTEQSLRSPADVATFCDPS